MVRIDGFHKFKKIKNYFINGSLDFWQRDTSFGNVDVGNTGQYTADRIWSSRETASTVNISRQDISSENLGVQYAIRSERSAGTAGWKIGTTLETKEIDELKGQKITFSVYLRKGAALTSDLVLNLKTTDTEARLSTSVDSAQLIISNSDLTTSFRRFCVSLNVPANTAGLALEADVTAQSQLGATNAYFEAAKMMINTGSTEPFNRAGDEVGKEELLVKRYFNKLLGGSGFEMAGQIIHTSDARTVRYPFEIPMRATPTVSIPGGTTGFSCRISGGGEVVNSVGVFSSTTQGVGWTYDSPLQSNTFGDASWLATSGGADTECDAEL